jgi:carbon storage regulator
MEVLMLVLTTKLEDGVQIGDDIRITIVDVRPRNVRLGIEAPRSMSIKRDPAVPQLQAPRSRSGSTAACSPHRNGDAAETTPLSMLIVGRDQPLLNRLSAVLKHAESINESLVVASMTDAKRQIDAIRQPPAATRPCPLVVLLDIDLSPQTAIVFLRWVRHCTSGREIAVVAMKSEKTPHATSSLIAAGANVVVNKDQPWNRVRRCLRAAIELWQNCEPSARMHTSSRKEAVA